MGIFAMFKNKQETREDFFRILLKDQMWKLDNSKQENKIINIDGTVLVNLFTKWTSYHLTDIIEILYMLNYKIGNLDAICNWFEEDFKKEVKKTTPREIADFLRGISLLLETYQKIGYTNYNKSFYTVSMSKLLRNILLKIMI